MFILGVDTTQAACSAAVYDTDSANLRSHVWQEMPRGHAEALPAIIGETLEQAGISLKDIGKIAATIGPGTFTGVRVGLSAARGFALALNLPLVGVSSLEALASAVEGFSEKTVLAAFDARRGEVYAQLFARGLPADAPQLLSIEQASSLSKGARTEIVGTARDLLVSANPENIASAAPQLPDAGVVARIAASRSPQADVQPLYLRKADAKAQKPLLQVVPEELSVSPATSAHADILAEIHQQGFSNAWDQANMASCLATPGTCGLIACDQNGQNEPLGFIIYRDAVGEREILTLAVRLDARRRNVASTLLAAITKQQADANIGKIFLEVSENNFAARHLYEKAGFSACGKRKNYYTENDGQKYDAVIMQRCL